MNKTAIELKRIQTDVTIAKVYQDNVRDVDNFTAGNTNMNEFITNNGRKSTQNDHLIAQQYQLNHYDLTKLTNGEIKLSEFETIKWLIFFFLWR